jgi:hypothetical protein
MHLFRQQFREFNSLKVDQIEHLIQLYDSNLNRPHETNSSQQVVMGTFFLFIGGLMMNSLSVYMSTYKKYFLTF